MTDIYVQHFIKICILNDMATDIGYFLQSQGAENFMDAMDLTCGAIPSGNYGQIVDQTSPEQFLKLYMGIAEHRFAFSITEALKINPNFLPAIKNYCSDKGTSIKIEKLQTLESAYDVINAFVLDGMPSEETKKIVINENNKFVWEKIIDTHQTAWNKAGGNIDIYYELQNCFIQGLLSASNFTFKIEENRIFTLDSN